MTPGLKVAHLSTHKSLIEAARYVTRATILEKLNLIHTTVTGWGIRQPRIGVAALNPHGGEGGLLGREEIEELTQKLESLIAFNMDMEEKCRIQAATEATQEEAAKIEEA